MKVLIRADASPRIGAGHVMRCMTLADALRERGAETLFVSALLPDELERRLRGSRRRLHQIEPLDDALTEPRWEREPAAGYVQIGDAAATAAAAGGWQPDWVVLDHYRFDAVWESAWRARSGGRILVLDDLANRLHACDLLVDQTFGRPAADYAALVPPHARLLVGARYALLGPEFRRVRSAALARRRRPAKPQSLVISLGATDIGGLTANVVQAAVDARIDCRINAVIGPGAVSQAAVAAIADAHSNVRLHVNSRNMADLLAEADVAIGAAGVSSLERCCVGLPSVLVTVAENQQLVARNLQAAGAALAVHCWGDAVPAALLLMADPAARSRMTAAAAAVTDGEGAQIVADHLFGAASRGTSPLVLRLATHADCEPLWLWRNDALMRAMAKHSEAIIWQDHAAWFTRVLNDHGTKLLIGEQDGVPVGMIRFDRLDEQRYLVSINVAPAWRGRGLGRALLDQGCRRFQACHPRARLEAEIRLVNEVSASIFAACGFRRAGDRRGDVEFARYERAAREADGG